MIDVGASVPARAGITTNHVGTAAPAVRSSESSTVLVELFTTQRAELRSAGQPGRLSPRGCDGSSTSEDARAHIESVLLLPRCWLWPVAGRICTTSPVQASGGKRFLYRPAFGAAAGRWHRGTRTVARRHLSLHRKNWRRSRRLHALPGHAKNCWHADSSATTFIALPVTRGWAMAMA